MKALLSCILFHSLHVIFSAIKKRVLVFRGSVTLNQTCLARQRFKEILGEDVPIPAYIEAECKSRESRHKRAIANNTGTLVLTFTFSEEIPLDCNFSCLNRIRWKLRNQYFEVQWKIASGLSLTITYSDISEQLSLILEGNLEVESDSPLITCTPGGVLFKDQGYCGMLVLVQY